MKRNSVWLWCLVFLSVLGTVVFFHQPSLQAADQIKVQFYNGSRTQITNTIFPNFKLVNISSSSIALSSVTMRYYFTVDSPMPLNAFVDQASIGSTNVTTAFHTVTGFAADYYLEIGFPIAAGDIAPGGEVTVEVRIVKEDLSNFNQANDYSFHQTTAGYVDWYQVTAYINGVRAFGTEPFNTITPTVTPTITPTPTPGPTPTPDPTLPETRIEASPASLHITTPVWSGYIKVVLKDESGAPLPGKTLNWTESDGFFNFLNGTSAKTDSEGAATIGYADIQKGTGTHTFNIQVTFAGDSEYAGSLLQIPVTVTLTLQVSPTPTRRPTPTQRRRITITPTVTPTGRGTVTPTPGRPVTVTPTATPTPTPGPGGYIVSYVIQSDWGSGATISVTIMNNTATAVNGWTLAWTFPGNQTITNLWNGTYTQSGAAVSVRDAGFNAMIAANGGSVNFGFNLNYSGTNPKPTVFTLNGVVCQVQ